MTGLPGDPTPQQEEPQKREAINVYDLAATASDAFTGHVHSPTPTPEHPALPNPITTALHAAVTALAATYTARREQACRAALADGTQGVLADATSARMDPRVPAMQFWQLPYTVTLADVDAGFLDDHLEFLREQVTGG